MMRRRRPRAGHGFTLIELLIAIVVAGILMTIAAFSLVRARANANESSAVQLDDQFLAVPADNFCQFGVIRPSARLSLCLT